MMESTDQQMVVAVNGVPAVKLSRDDEDYLDKLLSEKKVVDATAGLDCTQKLINAGKSQLEDDPAIIWKKKKKVWMDERGRHSVVVVVEILGPPLQSKKTKMKKSVVRSLSSSSFWLFLEALDRI